MTAEYFIYQGDTGPVLGPRPNTLQAEEQLTADWHCYIAVNDLMGNPIVLKREVTDKTGDGLRWVAAITPSESATLPVRKNGAAIGYDMIIEVSNSVLVPKFKVETHYRLLVKAQGIE